ncbi:hypothetical protein OG884_00280 [Streptosporangium sp. NBC_01755]|nr:MULTISPECIES: hypothetical protein [unclassified Streptosporangium]WSA28108.1 hypothetical protein OIE13_09690 [Streptosporangium sp. NBC_01810]WSD00420.1 hypothetical protein OG884_00280 [Streptosporangium sp. NBC_01755]
MTGDAWSDITREVMAKHPEAWVFFVAFMLVCTFVVRETAWEATA